MRGLLRRIAFAAAVGFCLLVSPALALGPAASQQQFEAPKLEIPIPNVSFTQGLSDSSVITLPWIAQYISGVYTFLISIVGAVAAVMMIIGGFQYLTSAGDKSRIAQGKKRIADALIGMVLAFGSYLLLYTINPNLVSFSSLQLLSIQTHAYGDDLLASDEGEYVNVEDAPSDTAGDTTTDTTAGAACGEVTAKFVDVHGVTGVSDTAKINAVTVDSFKAVAAEVYKRTASLPGGPYSLKGTGFRPAGQLGDYDRCHGQPKTGDCAEGSWSQAYKWEAKCLGKAKCTGAAICDPYKGHIRKINGVWTIDAGACPIADNCPHTTGSAVDITCTSPTFAKWFKAHYPGDKLAAEAPFYAPCQRILEDVMLENGWCRLWSEAWHFENPRKSGKACSNNLSDIRGKQKGGVDYRNCDGVYDTDSKTCVPVDF